MTHPPNVQLHTCTCEEFVGSRSGTSGRALPSGAARSSLAGLQGLPQDLSGWLAQGPGWHFRQGSDWLQLSCI